MFSNLLLALPYWAEAKARKRTHCTEYLSPLDGGVRLPQKPGLPAAARSGSLA